MPELIVVIIWILVVIAILVGLIVAGIFMLCYQLSKCTVTVNLLKRKDNGQNSAR